LKKERFGAIQAVNMSRIIGIDLGTTNSLAAAVDGGIPYVLADAEGQRLIPSVVNFPEGGEPLAGHPARRGQALRPENTVYSIKRFMGRRAHELEAWERNVPYRLSSRQDGGVAVELRGAMVSPEEISAHILRQLKRNAERALEEEVSRAVITVPAYFNDAQRNATKKAGELAGFTVERIVNEPTAAALAYGLDRLNEKARIAVYDFGGGTFDLSILELQNGVFQVLSTNGNTRLGGDDIDRALVALLAGRIQARGGPDIQHEPALFARAREAVEQAKIRLSTEEEVEISLPFLTPSFSFQTRLNRSELEAIARPIIEGTRAHCLRALTDARVESRELDQVILAGGQTRMPLVRRLVGEWFHCAEFEADRRGLRVGSGHEKEGPLLNTAHNPDEVVALGAAIQAEILSGGYKNMLLLDVTPLSLGIETFGGLMNVLIPRNSTIPTKAGEMFTTAVDNQKSMLIHVLQGERERARDNWSLGQFTIEFEPAPKGAPRVGVQFEIDASGILRVLARDTRSGREVQLEMRSAVDVNDQQVQRMVEESVEHAFTDMASRQWIEAAVRARETLEATQKALRELGPDAASSRQQAIEQAMQEVQEALATEQPGAQTGELARLKSAHAQLDEATKPLADQLMEKAMEEVLRRKGVLP
jgi:molecular chaperone DnaK